MKSISDVKQVKDVPAVVADNNGSILYVNGAFEQTFGWKSSEIIGKTLTTIIPKKLHDAHHMGFSRFLATETPTLLEKPLQLRAVAKNGHEFNAEHFIIAEKQDGGWLFGATIRPLKET